MYKRPGHRVIINSRGDLIVRPSYAEASVQRVPGGAALLCSALLCSALLCSLLLLFCSALLCSLLLLYCKKKLGHALAGRNLSELLNARIASRDLLQLLRVFLQFSLGLVSIYLQ